MVKILSGNVIFLAMCVAFIAGGWLYAGWLQQCDQILK